MRPPLPSGWHLATVADVAEVRGGIQKQPSRRPTHNKHPFLRVANVGRGRLDLKEIHEVELFPGELEKLALLPGDLLVVEGNGSPDQIGRSAMWHGEIAACVHQNHLIRVRPEGALVPRFLELLWNSSDVTQQLRRVASSTSGLYTLSTSKINAIVLAVPPLDEQFRIVSVLDHAEQLCLQRRESINLLDSLMNDVFLEMFGDPATNPYRWDVRELGELASIFSDGPFGSNLKSSHYTETGVRVVRLQNIGVGTFVDDDGAYISPEHFHTLRKHTCLPGDVLVGTLGDPNIRACIQPTSIPVALNKADCVQIRANPELSSAAFLCALLNQPSVEAMANSMMLGQTRVRISMGRLRTLKVPVPPRDLQARFSVRIESIRDLSARHRSHLAELDALFASLQHRAFSGTLALQPSA